MNNRIKRIYVAVNDNYVVSASTSLSDFVRTMSGIATGMKKYTYYSTKFKDQDVIKHVDMLGEVYYFQKIENKN